MPLKPAFSRAARRQIARLAKRNPAPLDRVVEMVAYLVNEPHGGLHRPEPLVGVLAGFWSVRLNHRDGLVYRVEGGRLCIHSVEGHYTTITEVRDQPRASRNPISPARPPNATKPIP